MTINSLGLRSQSTKQQTMLGKSNITRAVLQTLGSDQSLPTPPTTSRGRRTVARSRDRCALGRLTSGHLTGSRKKVVGAATKCTGTRYLNRKASFTSSTDEGSSSDGVQVPKPPMGRTVVRQETTSVVGLSTSKVEGEDPFGDAKGVSYVLGKEHCRISDSLLAYLHPFALFRPRNEELLLTLRARALVWSREHNVDGTTFARVVGLTIAEAFKVSEAEKLSLLNMGKGGLLQAWSMARSWSEFWYFYRLQGWVKPLLLTSIAIFGLFISSKLVPMLLVWALGWRLFTFKQLTIGS